MGKKDLSRQKKFETRIDFTPMVDMNMLLITFFMLCTTMLKSQTLKIALPSNSNEAMQEKNQNQAAESQAFTIILDGKEEEKEGTSLLWQLTLSSITTKVNSIQLKQLLS